MVSFEGGADLVILLKTVDMTNITALTKRPIIRRAGDDKEDESGSVSYESGELVIDKERYTPEDLNKSLRIERYVLTGTFSYPFETTDTTLKEMLREFDLVLRTETKSPTRSYDFKMEYNWDTNVTQSTVPLIFTLVSRVVLL